MFSIMVRALIGPNRGESMQTPNNFLVLTGNVMAISVCIVPEGGNAQN